MIFGGHQEAAARAYLEKMIRRRSRAAEAGRKARLRPGGEPETPCLRRSRVSTTHLHQSRRPVVWHPERFRHIAALRLVGRISRAYRMEEKA